MIQMAPHFIAPADKQEKDMLELLRMGPQGHLELSIRFALNTLQALAEHGAAHDPGHPVCDLDHVITCLVPSIERRLSARGKDAARKIRAENDKQRNVQQELDSLRNQLENHKSKESLTGQQRKELEDLRSQLKTVATENHALKKSQTSLEERLDQTIDRKNHLEAQAEFNQFQDGTVDVPTRLSVILLNIDYFDIV